MNNNTKQYNDEDRLFAVASTTDMSRLKGRKVALIGLTTSYLGRVLQHREGFPEFGDGAAQGFALFDFKSKKRLPFLVGDRVVVL